MSPKEGHDREAAATVARELTGLIEDIADYVEEKVAPILETFEQDAPEPEPEPPTARPAPGPLA